MDDKNWTDERSKFGLFLVCSIFFFTFSFISTPIYEQDELTRLNKTFISAQFNGGKPDNVEIFFEGEDEEFEIHRIEKTYLDKELFLEVKKGDELQIYVSDHDILRMKYKGVELMDKAKADLHKDQNRKFVRYISIIWIVAMFIPLTFKNQPALKMKEREYPLKMNWYYGGLIIIITLIIAYFLDSPNPQL